MRKRNFSKFSHHTLDTRGTEKTYASAFAVRELGYKKVLFLVHRNQIAEQAMKSYQKAMEENLLCPFHYFGITDFEIIDDEMVNGKKLTTEQKLENFRFLTSDERVKYIMEQARYYGYSGDRVKGLIFCSRIEEAQELSKKFNEHGWRTLALSGSDSEEVRRDAIERLVNDDINELDYILSVDIFSEGVDVPEINQVIMLRPTQSPIVFIQQLGRGLRKAEDKEYVVILDFISSQQENPLPLGGGMNCVRY